VPILCLGLTSSLAPPFAGFCHFAGDFVVESRATSGEASLSRTSRSVCAAHGRLTLRTHRPAHDLDPDHASAACSRCARRPSARSCTRPRTRSRRAGNARDHSLHGAAACRHFGQPPSSPAPVESTHGTPTRHRADPSPTLFRGRIAAEGPVGGGNLRQYMSCARRIHNVYAESTRMHC
jgi:hypothetical protein